MPSPVHAFIVGALLSASASDGALISITGGTLTYIQGSSYTNRFLSTMDKTITSSTWVAGDGGSCGVNAAADSAYHVFFLADNDNVLAPDVFCSSSLNPASIPTGYETIFRIGTIFTDSSGDVLPFQTFFPGSNSRYVEFTETQVDATNATMPTSATSLDVSTPPDVDVMLHYMASVSNLLGDAEMSIRSVENTQDSSFSSGGGHQCREAFTSAAGACSGVVMASGGSILIDGASSNSRFEFRTVGYDDRL